MGEPGGRNERGWMVRPESEASLEPMTVQTPGGRIEVHWEPEAAVTAQAQLAFFAEFLAAGGVYQKWVRTCPLQYASNNASEVADVPGTWFLSILAGHCRYAHVTGLRGGQASRQILGMKKMVSADAENAFDELKNQWGWGGFTTQDMNRCQTAARAVALVYNGWIWYGRAAKPQARMEAATSRPLLLNPT